MTFIRVGGAEVRFAEAQRLVSDYVSKNGKWAYPAYDGYAGSGGNTLGDADLLAPVLLNVAHLSLKSYYAMQELIPDINARLSGLAGETLVHADEAALGELSDLLALHGTAAIPGVGLTKFSKVLHRMAPDLIPLYDTHIRRCYMDCGEPVVRRVPRGSRTEVEFTALWVRAVQADLREYLHEWKQLASLAAEPTITPLRALDIVGWNLGRPRSSAGSALSEVAV